MSSEQDRCKMYVDSKTSIKKMLIKDITVDKRVLTNHLILIKEDLYAQTSTIDSALDMLDFLINNIQDPNLHHDIIKLLNDSNIDKNIKNTITDSIKQAIATWIKTDTFNITNHLSLWKSQNVQKLINIIGQVCENCLEKTESKQFFIKKVIPEMMNVSTNNEIRTVLIDIAYKLLLVIFVDDLTDLEFRQFVNEVITNYIKSIGDLRDQDFAGWHCLWIFLLRFCGKKIHYSMDLTNRLLRVVEYAFRNQACSQRLKGYDCWKELIDNASLDPLYLSSNKQIKLLVTPLKAKFSKQEVVIIKRFDIFVYLLEKLNENGTLCVIEFLEFCLGPVGGSMDVTKTGQAKCVEKLLPRIVGALMDVIGHAHNDEECVEKQINFSKPIINDSNFSFYYKPIIKSIEECGLLSKSRLFDDTRDKIITCMWKSLLNLVLQNEEQLENCLEMIVLILSNYSRQSNEFPVYSNMLCCIFDVILSFEGNLFISLFETIPTVFLNIVFRTKSERLSKYSQNIIREVVCASVNNEINFSEVMEKLDHVEPIESINIPLAIDVWFGIGNYINSHVSKDQFEAKNYFKPFFMWVVNYYHEINKTDSMKNILNLWIKMYKKFESSKFKIIFLKELESKFDSNPLLYSNIMFALGVISQFEQEFDKDFVTALMKLTSKILQLSTLQPKDEEELSVVVQTYFDPSLKFYSQSQNDVAIKHISNCIKLILCVHEDKTILVPLSKFFDDISETSKSHFARNLSASLLTLHSEQTDLKSEAAKNLQTILKVLNIASPVNESKPKFRTPNGTSRISSIMKNFSPVEQKKAEPSPTTLRLFGKDVETFSPLNVKGSQLNNTPLRTRKIISRVSKPSPKKPAAPIFDEESTANFVVFDTEVKIEKDKLNEHQTEVMKKRRDDIPALYQDLSQSQSHSQDLFNVKSMKKIVETKEEKIAATLPETNVENSEKMEVNNELEQNKETQVDETQIPDENMEVDSKEEPQPPQEEEVNKTEIEEAKPENEIQNKPKPEDDKIKLKIEAELKRLKMDIVASDQFLVTTRRLRPEKPSVVARTPRQRRKKEDSSSSGSDEKAKPKDEKTTKGKEQRRSLVQIKGENKPENRRKTIGVVKELTPESTEAALIVAETKKDSPKKETSESPKKQPPKKNTEVEETLPEPKRSPRQQSKEKIEEIQQNQPAEEPKKKRSRSTKKQKPDDEPTVETSPEKIPKEKVDQPTEETLLEPKTSPKQQSNENIEEEPKKRRSRTTKKQKSDEIAETSSKEPVKEKKIRRIKPQLISKLTSKDEDKENSSEEINENLAQPVNESIDKTLILEDSEDIIESSQESTVNITPISSPLVRLSFNKSNGLSGESSSTQNVPIKDDVIEETPAIVTQNLNITESQTQEEETTAHEETLTQTETETCDSNLKSTSANLQVDLPQKPKLTDSEKMMSEMDTVSFSSDLLAGDQETINAVSEVISETSSEAQVTLKPNIEEDNTDNSLDLLASPVSRGESIPSSPVTGDTPTRTTELLTNTLDISPIPEVKVEEVVANVEPTTLYNFDEDIEMQISTEKTNDEVPEKPIVGSERSSRLLNMINIDSPISHRMFYKKRKSCIHMSPSAARIKKLMSPFKFGKYNSHDDAAAPVEYKEEDILTFSREVPSPLAVPKSSILKRKFSDVSEEGVSPCPKRKRVNFSYPTTTSKKVFIKEDPPPNEKPALEAKILFDTKPNDKDDLKDLVALDCDTNNAESESPIETESSLEITNANDKDDLKDLVALDCDTNNTESESPIETESSLEITNALLLESNKPIYPKLVDCEDAMKRIIRRLTSPCFVGQLGKVLKEKNVNTVGDFSKLSEADVNRLPLKTPPVSTAYRVLDNYYNTESNVNGVEEEYDDVIIEKEDVRKLFKECLEKALKEGISVEELSDTLASSMEQSDLNAFFKRHKPDLETILSEYDFKKVLTQVVENNGLDHLIESLPDTTENNKDLFYCYCILKHSMEKKPITISVEEKSVEELKTGLEASLFNRKEVLDSLAPANSNTTSLRQLNETVVKNVKSEDLGAFIEQLQADYSDDLFKCIDKKRVLEICSREELTEELVRRPASDVVNTCKETLDNLNEESLVDMFKFISSKLPNNTLLKLHIDYLNDMKLE